MLLSSARNTSWSFGFQSNTSHKNSGFISLVLDYTLANFHLKTKPTSYHVWYKSCNNKAKDFNPKANELHSNKLIPRVNQRLAIAISSLSKRKILWIHIHKYIYHHVTLCYKIYMLLSIRDRSIFFPPKYYIHVLLCMFFRSSSLQSFTKFCAHKTHHNSQSVTCTPPITSTTLHTRCIWYVCK